MAVSSALLLPRSRTTRYVCVCMIAKRNYNAFLFLPLLVKKKLDGNVGVGRRGFLNAMF